MKKVTCLLLSFISVACFSQTIKELENDLRTLRMDEKFGNKKAVAYQLLKIDTFNPTAVDYLVRIYDNNKQMDSIVHLYNRLAEENPKSPEPYLLMAETYELGLSANRKIDLYEKAYKLDNHHIQLTYELGKLYYEQFVKEFTNTKNKEKLDGYSSNAIKYFTNFCNLDNSYREALSYPLLQLATYQGDAALKTRFKQFNVQTTYFPFSAFLILPTDWQTNFSVDVMGITFKKNKASQGGIQGLVVSEYEVHGLESARFLINWYSKSLHFFNEPVLSKTQSENVYRFTWLRSFHNPIVIGIEKKANGSISLYWKEGELTKDGGLGKILKEDSKVLTLNEWTEFENAIHAINYWNMPTLKREALLGSDGSEWILEGKEAGKYHVVNRWTGQDIEKVCLQLLKLTDLVIKSDEIY